MLAALSDTDVQLSKSLGMYVQPGIATAYPELSQMLRIMYRDRFAKLPFVPADWFAHVDALQGTPISGANYNDILLPLPTYDNFGKPSASLPEWLSASDANLKAWDAARVALKDGYTKFINNQIDEGRTLLNSLYAKADFWNGLYTAVVSARNAIRDAPFTAIKAIWDMYWPWMLVGFLGWSGYQYVVNDKGPLKLILGKKNKESAHE